MIKREKKQQQMNACLNLAYMVDTHELKCRSTWPSKCPQTHTGVTFALEPKGYPKPFPQTQTHTHTEKRAVLKGANLVVLQPIHRQWPDDFIPGYHGNQEYGLLLVAWGMWVCFSHKHAELAARIQDACQERRETDPHHLTPGPSALLKHSVLAQKSTSRWGPLRCHVIR